MKKISSQIYVLVFCWILCTVTIFTACKTKDSQPDKCRFWSISFVNQIKEANDTVQVIKLLNSSNFLEAEALFQKNFLTDTLVYNSYNGIVISEKIKPPYLLSYLSYRIADYKDDLDRNLIGSILVKNWPEESEACIREVLEFESLYNSILEDLTDSSYINENFKTIQLQYDKNRKYERIRYLWAILNVRLRREFDIEVLKQLYRENYYKEKCLQHIIDYYINKNNDSALLYHKELMTSFPTHCQLYELRNLIGKRDFPSEFNKCISSTLKDSIKATVFLAEHLIKNKDLQKFEHLWFKYKENNIEVFSDEVKQWERKQFYDLRLVFFLLNNSYENVINFILNEYPNPDINTETDLKNLIKEIFFRYNLGNPSDFENFYERNIKSRITKFKEQL